MSFPLINPTPQFFDSSGSPLASGTIEFRNPTSNALINSYPTADDADAQTNENDNPLTLNARGEAANGLYLEDGVKYKVILKDADGDTVWTQDDVRCPVFSQASIGEKIYPITAAETSAGVTPTNYYYPEGHVLRYGTNTTPGTTDMTTARDSAISVAKAGGRVAYFPEDSYLFTTQLAITSSTNPFKICGDGRRATTWVRGADFTGGFVSITDSSNIEICDIGFDANHSTYTSGSHCIRLNRCSKMYLHRLYVTDWADTGIIHFDSDAGASYYDDVVVENCFLDGASAANNGILLSYTQRGVIRGCAVKDLGKSGTPQIALQLKSKNIDSKITDCTAINAQTGLSIGSDEIAFPSNEFCQFSNIIIRDCLKGVNVSESRYIQGDGLLIDMDPDGVSTYTYAVDIRSSAANCSLSDVAILNYDGANQPVRIRSADGNTLHVSHWQNTPDAGTFVAFENDSDNNIVIVDNMVGNIPTYTGDLATFESDCQSNSFTIGRSPIVVQATIASGSVTNRNHGATRLVVDTESAASSDDLDTISAGVFAGNRIAVTIAAAARNVVLKHETGNLHMKGDADRTLDVLTDIALFEWSAAASKWIEI